MVTISSIKLLLLMVFSPTGSAVCNSVMERSNDTAPLRDAIAPKHNTTAAEIYYYHTDHLGSSAWITDSVGTAIQHLHYLPWREPYVTQKTGNFNPTYTFSDKERDEETGYSYFGQRFYDSEHSFWISVDPMRHKYPSLSPFVYCANNPLRLVDPNGMELVIDGKEQTKKDIISMIDPKYQNRISFENNLVTVDVRGLTDDEIKNDAGLSLINDLSNSDKRYYYETKSISNQLGIENNSITPRNETSKKGDVLPKGFHGHIALNDKNIWYDDKNQEINRPSLVFHELQENYERTDNLLPYMFLIKCYDKKGRLKEVINNPNRKGAHDTAIYKANKLTNTAKSSYPEGKVHHIKRY